MKINKILIVLSLSFFATTGFGQVNPHAIGLRGGSGNFGSGAEVSYQHGFGSANRLELDLGWRGNNRKNHYYAWALTGVYHWVWNLEGGLNWFVGLGGQIGTYKNYDYDYDDGLILNAGGQIGIEYDFNELGAPIQLGLDIRPMWGFLGGYRGIGYGGALSLRYTF